MPVPGFFLSSFFGAVVVVDAGSFVPLLSEPAAVEGLVVDVPPTPPAPAALDEPVLPEPVLEPIDGSLDGDVVDGEEPRGLVLVPIVDGDVVVVPVVLFVGIELGLFPMAEGSFIVPDVVELSGDFTGSLLPPHATTEAMASALRTMVVTFMGFSSVGLASPLQSSERESRAPRLAVRVPLACERMTRDAYHPTNAA